MNDDTRTDARRFEPDDAGPDAGPDLDLTPRAPRQASTRSRRWGAFVVLALVVAALGFVVVKTLGDAAFSFYNADEAVERRDDLGDERFQIQGTPLEGTITEGELESRSAVAFSIAFDGVVVDVVHVGDPAELFQPNVPVVLQGQWRRADASTFSFVGGARDGYYFESDTMIVKHDNEYRNDNRERIEDAEERGQRPAGEAATS